MRASAWNGLCYAACENAQTAAVALVDSGALHCFMSETLVTEFELLVLPGDGIEVTLADINHVEASKTCLVPFVLCSAHKQALHYVDKCLVMPRLIHDIVLGVDWLQATNFAIDW